MDDDPIEIPRPKLRIRVPMPVLVVLVGILGFGAIAYFGGVGGRRTIRGQQRDNLAAAGEAAARSNAMETQIAQTQSLTAAIDNHARTCPAGTSPRVVPEEVHIRLSCVAPDGQERGAVWRVDPVGTVVERSTAP